MTAIRGLLIGLAVLLTWAPAAWAAPYPVGAGETRLSLDRALAKQLREDGVAVKALGPAKSKGRKLILPVASGSFEPDASTAAFAQAGGLRLVAGGRSATLRGLRLDASTRRLSAKVAGKRIALARLAGTRLERQGFRLRLTAKRLSLTHIGATALNRLLDVPDTLRAGRSLGSVDAFGEASEVELSFSRIVIGSAPETSMAKLESNKVDLGLSGGTEAWGNPLEEPQREHVFLLEAQPTWIAANASSGIVESVETNGISMQAVFRSPPGDLLLRHPRIDLATGELAATLSPLSTEKPVTAVIATLDLGAAKRQIRPGVGAIELMSIPAIANQLLADQLNERLGSPGLFQAGETFAQLTLILRSR